MRRLIIALVLTTSALTATACDANVILDNIEAKSPKSDFHPDFDLTNPSCGNRVCKTAH